ncbi:MAG TPA: hypothetical protein VI172_01690 [Candidatus Dormibacteraeota bacterium]|jgi:hypothetical protein
MPNRIQPLTAYDSDAYIDIDRAAALALRMPLLTQLHTVPLPDRTAWLTSLAAGLTDGLGTGVERNTDAYALGQRIALLLIEEGHA